MTPMPYNVFDVPADDFYWVIFERITNWTQGSIGYNLKYTWAKAGPGDVAEADWSPPLLIPSDINPNFPATMGIEYMPETGQFIVYQTDTFSKANLRRSIDWKNNIWEPAIDITADMQPIWDIFAWCAPGQFRYGGNGKLLLKGNARGEFIKSGDYGLNWSPAEFPSTNTDWVTGTFDRQLANEYPLGRKGDRWAWCGGPGMVGTLDFGLNWFESLVGGRGAQFGQNLGLDLDVRSIDYMGPGNGWIVGGAPQTTLGFALQGIFQLNTDDDMDYFSWGIPIKCISSAYQQDMYEGNGPFANPARSGTLKTLKHSFGYRVHNFDGFASSNDYQYSDDNGVTWQRGADFRTWTDAYQKAEGFPFFLPSYIDLSSFGKLWDIIQHPGNPDTIMAVGTTGDTTFVERQAVYTVSTDAGDHWGEVRQFPQTPGDPFPYFNSMRRAQIGWCVPADADASIIPRGF